MTPGVSLRRGLLGENDRLCVIYTADLGKLSVRFMGVNRPHGKLKALSEPLVMGEYRLHTRDAPGAAKNPAFPGEALSAAPISVLCVGGALVTVFPLLRADFGRLLRGLELCEMMDRLTPFGQPNPEKFALISSALSELERARTPSGAGWICAAFALRLLRAAGFGVAQLRVSPEHRLLWERLHSADLAEVAELPADEARLFRLESYLLRSVERVSERPMRSSRMRAQLAAARK